MLRIATGLAVAAMAFGCSSKDDPPPQAMWPEESSGGNAGSGSDSGGGESGGAMSSAGGFVGFGDASLPVKHRPEAGVPVDGGNCESILAIVRDFTTAHPDFEEPLPSNQDGMKGLVEDTLVQGYPAYKPAGSTTHTSGPAGFAQWYVDTPGVNERF